MSVNLIIINKEKFLEELTTKGLYETNLVLKNKKIGHLFFFPGFIALIDDARFFRAKDSIFWEK